MPATRTNAKAPAKTSPRSRGNARVAALKSSSAVALASRDLRLTAGCWRLQRLAQRSFNGWATTHQTRWWEYPWVVDRVRQRLSGRLPTAADFGAGRSPTPIALAQLGLSTTVVDPDSQAEMGKRVGGEWNQPDYGRWGIKSVRAGVEDGSVFADSTLGFAVSVSVIEHLPAEVRRAGLRNMARFLEPDGVAIFTVDLVKGTSQLWNRILGTVVEPVEIHGDLDGLVAECGQLGLQLEESTRCPLSEKYVDVQGLVFRKG